MIEFFDELNYKNMVKNWLILQPQKGRGLYKKMAEALSLSAVTISQVFNGDKDLSLEQALKLVTFMGLGGLKKEYFLNLVQYQRAGSKDLELHFAEKLTHLRAQSKDLKTRLVQDITLSDADKARFYSDWIYSGVRLATSVETLKTSQEIAERFQLPEATIQEIISFLLRTGLVEENGQRLAMGPQRVHLESGSPYIKARQMSWRLKAFERMGKNESDELFYTAPMSVNKKSVGALKEIITSAIEKMNEKVVSEKPDELVCLNIDFFRF